MFNQIFPDKDQQTLEREEERKIRIPERQTNPNFEKNDPKRVDPTRIEPNPQKEGPERQNPYKNDPTRITRENDPGRTDPTRPE